MQFTRLMGCEESRIKDTYEFDVLFLHCVKFIFISFPPRENGTFQTKSGNDVSTGELSL